MSLTLGIIGTAGRGPDAAKLTVTHWNVMCAVAQTVAKLTGTDRLVSGGAAYGDHAAVRLYLKGIVPNLTLHLPAVMHPKHFWTQTKAGEISNLYHDAFTRKIGGWPTYLDIVEAKAKGATVTEQTADGLRGFFIRNALIAKEADMMLAFTFSPAGQSQLKDSGTKDTMDTFLKRRGRREEGPLADLRAYHYNLTDSVLYCL